jgi:acetyl-CoA carboxylase carboxyltransferase component
VSGVADLEVGSDKECIEAIRKYLAFFPQHCKEKAPRLLPSGIKKAAKALKPSKFAKGAKQQSGNGKAHDGFDRLAMSDAVLDILPQDSRKGYDMRDVIHHIVDPNSWFEIKPEFARNIITGLARIDGWSVGILANQPEYMGGAIDIDASDKAARFLWLCDAYNIPVVFLHDCPGFMVGSRMEKLGIIRHGAKMLFALSEMSVPKFSIIVRRSYGAGYYVMCGKGYEPDLIVGWPTAEVSLMSPEGAVNIIFRKEIAADPNPEAARAKRTEQYRKMIGGHISASQGHLDDIIDPRETRRILAQALAHTRAKRVPRPPKKHGVLPV